MYFGYSIVMVLCGIMIGFGLRGYFMDSSDVAYERDTFDRERYEEDCNALQTHINLMGGAEYGV